MSPLTILALVVSVGGFVLFCVGAGVADMLRQSVLHAEPHRPVPLPGND